MTDRIQRGWASIVLSLLAGSCLLPLASPREVKGADLAADSTEERVFVPPDRPTRLLLDRAEQLLAQHRYSEAVQALNSVLNAPEDFFYLPEGDHASSDRGQTYRSLKGEARRLIGTLPEEGRKSYELQYGAEAKRRLDRALGQGDIEAVADVARRYFHTDAGYDAMYLMGRYQMDQGHPLAAALCFEQLQRAATVASYEPGLTVLLAVCWQRSGQPEKATELLAGLRRRQPDAHLTIAGIETELFRGPGAIDHRLEEIAGSSHAGALRGWREWTMFGGDPARTMQTDGGRPLLLQPCWRQRVTFDSRLAEAIATRGQQLYDQSQPALPALHALAVGDLVLTRSPGRLSAVDVETGKIVWKYEPAEEKKSGDDEIVNEKQEPSNEQNRESEICDQIWHDNTYGTMSSDGDLVFVVEEPGNDLVEVDASGRRHSLPPPDAPTNVLAAYHVKQVQGKVRWTVGGRDGVEPTLAQAFFLGPPLPLQGRLYVIAELAGEIRLVVLAADTGKLQWSQQLAVVDEEVARDLTRHRSGISPSFADNVLVCPTTVGALVAIDLTTRSLLWGYQYSRDAAVVWDRDSLGPWAGRIRSATLPIPLPATWCDSQVMIAGGRVLITPAESTQLHCLNLSDGHLDWKLQRGEYLYVACIHRDKAFLVARDFVSQVPLSGPKQGTPSGGGKRGDATGMPLPDGAIPSGRGYYSDHSYYLPLQTPLGGEVARIDLDDLRIAEKVRSQDGSVPGNLICYRDQVISQGPDWLQNSYQFEALQHRVAAALKKNADDPWALSHSGELLMEQRKYGEAVPMVRRAVEQYGRLLEAAATPENRAAQAVARGQLPLARELLVDGLLKNLQTHFDSHQQISAELARLPESPPQRLRYLRLMAVGLQKSGDLAGAVKTYFDLIDEAGPPDQMLTIEPAHVVRLDRWIAASLGELVPQLPDELRQKFNQRVAERWEQIRDRETQPALEAHLVMFAGHPTAALARLHLARRLEGSETLLQRQRLLEPLAESGPEDLRPEAVARLALLMTEADHPEEAAPYYQRLLDQWPDAVCLRGKTGRELFNALPPGSPARAVSGEPASWPTGAVKVTPGDAGKAYSPSGQPVELTNILGRQAAVPLRIFVDSQQRFLGGLDPLGQTRWRLPLAHDEDNPYGGRALEPRFMTGRFDGHLLMLSMGSQVMGIDMLRSGHGSQTEGVLWTDEAGNFSPTESADRIGSTLDDGHSRHRARSTSKSSAQRNWAAPWEFTDSNPAEAEHERSRFGAITAGGVPYLRNRELVSVDPISGNKLWTRRDIPSGCELIGDEEVLLVVPARAGDGRSTAMALRALDGTLLGRCEIPRPSDRWTTIGRRIVTARLEPGGSGDLLLVLVDPWQKKDNWTLRVKAGAKAALLDETTAALLDREGHFSLLDLRTGKTSDEVDLEPEPRLSGLYVQGSRDRLLVIANERTRGMLHNTSIIPAQENGGPMITGRIYALDRQTGRPLWPVPATVEDFALVSDQPNELPLLVFARYLLSVSESGESAQQTEFLFLDKRTGALATPTREFSSRINNFDIVGDADKKTVTVQLRTTSSSLILTLTDLPTPPEPPIQIEGHRYAESRALRDTLGSVMKAFSKAAEQLQGLPVDQEEQEKDLFGK